MKQEKYCFKSSGKISERSKRNKSICFRVFCKKSQKFFKIYRNPCQSPFPANIRLDEDVLKTFFVFAFKRPLDEDEYILINLSSRRLGQGQYIRLVHTSSRRLQDVFKMSSRCLAITSSRRFQGVFKTSCKKVFKTSSRCL